MRITHMLNGSADHESVLVDNLRKIPPQNLEAESAVLGSVLLDSDCLSDILAVLSGDDFYREAHRKIFCAMMEMAERGDPIDVLTLSDSLKAKSDLEAAGGSAYLTALVDFTPTSANVLHYAKIVKRDSQLRNIIAICREAV